MMSKPMLLLVGCLLVGLYQNWGSIEHWLSPQQPVGGLPGAENVILYATQWCGYCAKTRKFFAKNKIAYTEVDVETTAVGRTEYKRLGAGGVPIIVINGATVIHGFDPDAINEALGRIP